MFSCDSRYSCGWGHRRGIITIGENKNDHRSSISTALRIPMSSWCHRHVVITIGRTALFALSTALRGYQFGVFILLFVRWLIRVRFRRIKWRFSLTAKTPFHSLYWLSTFKRIQPVYFLFNVLVFVRRRKKWRRWHWIAR